MNNQEECSFSESDLFKRPVVQCDVLNGKFEKIYLITKLEDSGPIEFLTENTIDHFLDLRQSYPNTESENVNSDCSNLVADAKVGLVNHLIASLFQQMNVLLNGNLITSSTNTYAYRATLEVLLGQDIIMEQKTHILLWDSTANTQHRKWI